MDGANADSDHSMSWEDFFGSTTDLTPTLIGIYDALLEPAKSLRPEVAILETAKDARNDPPVPNATMTEDKNKEITVHPSPPKHPSKIIGSVKLPIATLNKSSLYNLRTKSDGVSDKSDPSDDKIQRTFKEAKTDAFDNLSPNVKRMLSSASETTTLRFQKKTVNITRSSGRKCNIPLVGATSKISQSGLEILPSVEIYDQPNLKLNKIQDSPPLIKPDFKIDEPETYDVPTNNQPAIYDVPNNNKTAFESLSLPYIDQSIELSISNDREFDTKLSSKENSPLKPNTSTPLISPAKLNDTLPRKESKLVKSGPYPQTVGSTGNLRPEKEMARLNPPLQVTRPLSMSSIASSSSTSSSGVQNKGVNSAYLASIESLDDHSDADMTSGNGSNNFMNSTGILKTSISEESRTEMLTNHNLEELSGLSQLERVCAEIVQTENVYVEDLRQVVEGYLHVWRRDATFSEDELTELFNNIEDIYGFNKSLCAELNSCHLDATCIARCFVNNTSGFSVYTSYCTGYPCTMERLAALASKPQSAREFRERQLGLNHPLPLASYLLKPVQRILKYHLLLQNLVKQCASRETEYAFLKMTGIAQHIDDMKRRHEHAVRVQEIQSLLYGWSGPDLTTYGELCAEGTFRVFGAKAMRHAFLFDKMLLVTKNREDGILAYKSHIMCNNMMLVESISGAPLSFHVIPWDAPRAQLTLQARSPRHKREWTLLLKRVILENYNAVIPSHARQLVMELGQNKTDDDILAEKSHNLITQASMRKQLSAPEYLEKRKLERERRKSFENGTRGRSKKPNRKHTIPDSRDTSQDCDCAQVSAEKGTDYTCDNCYIDLCSDCEIELSKDKKEEKCTCKTVDDDKCPECDRSLNYIDAGSAENVERKPICKCSDFKSSQESFSNNLLNKTRCYHSSDNIVGYDVKSKEDVSDLTSVKIPKTCLKCSKIKENIPVTDSVATLHTRKSRCVDIDKTKSDTLRSKSKDDPQRSKLSRIGTWRRKSEPGLQQNGQSILAKRSHDSDSERNDGRNDKIEFECRNCGSNRINKKIKSSDGNLASDIEERRKLNVIKQNLEIKMYNTKNIPKKITKIKKNRAKGRVTSDTTTRFYTDFSSDVSTEILHISESNDSLNVEDSKDTKNNFVIPETITKDEGIDEETYKKLIEKTDSFKKNELEKVKYLHKQKIINEGSEIDEKAESQQLPDDVQESCEENEQPLEQIISQLLMQNREFQKLLKKQQLRNTAQKRHQRLLKSHSIPDQVISGRNEVIKFKPKFGRQLSENLQLSIDEDDVNNDEHHKGISDDDHIYETLRVEDRLDESLHSLNSKSKIIQHHPPNKKSPPSSLIHLSSEKPKKGGPESDYVYLSFEEIKKVTDALDNGIYDVPAKTPEKVVDHPDRRISTDYYVTMEHNGPATESNENLYDNLVDICRRKKEAPNTLPADYLPMSPDHQSPNTPEIWLSRQKEHFNVSRDRKSGSLPRSFQVPTSSPEDNNLSTFKSKPNANSKTYLNRDGKVMSVDRPFTIASDQSEISYDDVEAYMSEGDILKFNKNSKSTDDSQNISKSTLELEEEIDRCYKNNFEKIDLDSNKNENILKDAHNHLNISVASSCEALIVDQSDKSKMDVIHPEHKIYKPNGNVLSLKNVLSRFKNRSPPKGEEMEINANEQCLVDNKSDLKSPTSEKRSGLNPRSYSKNLLQRFRNIIGDEHSDDNQNKIESKVSKIDSNEIKVVITSAESSPTTFSIVYSASDALSKSVCENTTMSESQTEKNNLELLSHSCDNLSQKPFRPSYEKSVSMMTSMPNSISSTPSPSKSNNSSYQSLHKLPSYMQGSRHLGARIAQSDYVDPMTLLNERNQLKNINILINKNSMRPDSLFSNSSFVTSSSESTYQEPQKSQNQANVIEKPTETAQIHSDESFYEKTFEKIEQVTDEDVFRDSAVYSDQEDAEDKEPEKPKQAIKLKRVESLKRESSFNSKKIISSITEISSIQTVTINKIHSTTKSTVTKEDRVIRPKIAPPVPIKPKITQTSVSTIQTKTVSNKNLVKEQQTSSSESVNNRTIKRNTGCKPGFARSESTPPSKSDGRVKPKAETNTKHEPESEEGKTNIQIKRLGFERASLDSATRKRPVEKKRSLEQPKTKSVLERRMELEQLTKAQSRTIKKPAVKPKLITTKVQTFERSENTGDNNVNNDIPVDKPSINDDPNDEQKGSWVKQVVNKFQ
ncbi:uncharacterized protein LOC125052392 [Pieris napi]|uniref:uncharacterized protein LOC125052392 n=1 Tax=Pieris napi TaxID=78633 RepID=UPI001FBB8202|nr:uncharacterized protein LOC125052392 [Pieris napi]